MPLVVLCGIPCSGKTVRSKQLVDYLETRCPDHPIHIVEDNQSSSRDERYSSRQQEITNRASMKSSVERYLGSDNVVILDSLNYIKGYRYELYCASKHSETPHCVLLCETPVETAREWNSARKPSQKYSPHVFDALLMRFEAPDSRNRWDKPLFVLYPDDPLPGDDIYNALFLRKPPPPNQSTQSQPLSETNFLHELDRLTQDVIRNIMDTQRTSVPGEYVVLSNSQERVKFPRHITMAELRRHRKQFISYTKLHPTSDHLKIPTLFIQYLNRTVI